MISKETQIEALEALAKNEELLSELYGVLREKFPKYEEFWEELVKDELAHAAWVRELIAPLKEGSLFFKTDRFNKDAIQGYSKYVAEEIENVSKGKISLKEAFSISLNVEETLIEKEYFEVFDTDSLSLKYTLLHLKLATQKHIKKIKRAWDKIKKKV